MAVGAPAGSIIGRNLNLIVGPDDKVLQEQTGLVWVSDVSHLTINWKPWQAVPGSRGSNWSTAGGRDKTAQRDINVNILEHKFKEQIVAVAAVWEKKKQCRKGHIMATKRELTTDEVRGRYLIGTNYSTAVEEWQWSEMERKKRGWHLLSRLNDTDPDRHLSLEKN